MLLQEVCDRDGKLQKFYIIFLLLGSDSAEQGSTGHTWYLVDNEQQYVAVLWEQLN